MALHADHNTGNRGFTLVEVLIAMLIGGIVLGAVMTSFQSQHNVYLAQDQVVEMQQNARAAMDMLVRDIRSAGYDPNHLGAGITVAGAQTLSFTREDDLAANGLETITYDLYDAFATSSPPGNDGLVDDLARTVITAAGATSNRQVAVENISQLEFRYLDTNGNVTAILGDIRSIQVSLMAQAAFPDNKTPPPARTYTTPSGTVWNSTPRFRSVYLTSTVQCRNLGL